MMNFDNLRKELEKKDKGHQNKPEYPFRPANQGGGQKKMETEEIFDGVDLETILKRVSLFFGIFLAVISIYFSYDGLDNSVTGGNAQYSNLAKLIGVVLATAATVLQFVFSSSYNKLNATLKFFGLMSYVYSMYTNYLGITHILQMEQMAIVVTLFMDGVPEPLISWALGSSMKGDFIGNMLKTLFGAKPANGKRTYQMDENIKDRLGH